MGGLQELLVHLNYTLGHFGSHSHVRPQGQKELISRTVTTLFTVTWEISPFLSKRKVEKSLLCDKPN